MKFEVEELRIQNAWSFLPIFFTKKVQVNYPSVFEVAREPPQDALVYLAW